ncbi:hypothetical protein CBM2626_U20049 [Cupriavidus taiwanensis]|nr:hypothetical protein CBM2626_U20049 [Cupriavidus taiwanensis]
MSLGPELNFRRAGPESAGISLWPAIRTLPRAPLPPGIKAILDSVVSRLGTVAGNGLDARSTRCEASRRPFSALEVRTWAHGHRCRYVVGASYSVAANRIAAVAGHAVPGPLQCD